MLFLHEPVPVCVFVKLNGMGSVKVNVVMYCNNGSPVLLGPLPVFSLSLLRSDTTLTSLFASSSMFRNADPTWFDPGWDTFLR